MSKWFNELLSSENNKSSARLINIIGAINGTILLGYDTYIRHGLQMESFAVYLAYCGGVYVGGKILDSKTPTPPPIEEEPAPSKE